MTALSVLPVSPATASASGWSAPQKVDQSLQFVSCPTSTFCLATNGSVGVDTFNGQSWSPGPATPDIVTSLSCTSATFCVALGQDNEVFTYDGQSWSASQTLSSASNVAIQSLSCGSSSPCMAVGSQTASGTTSDVAWVYDGQSWQSTPSFGSFVGGNELGTMAVPCAGAFCAAGDYKGQLSTFANGAWSATSAAHSGYPVGISCVSSQFCLASLRDGSTYAFNGSSWSSAGSYMAPLLVSCVSSSICLGTGGTVGYYDGSSWTQESTIPAVDVSCASATFCVAVDSGGNAYSFSGLATGGSGGGGNQSQPGPPKIAFARLSASVARHGGLTNVGLICGASAACAGTLKLTVRERVHERKRVHGRLKTITKTVTVIIARAGYRLAAGSTGSVRLRLKSAVVKLIGRAGKVGLRASASASISGGSTTSTMLRLRVG